MTHKPSDREKIWNELLTQGFGEPHPENKAREIAQQAFTDLQSQLVMMEEKLAEANIRWEKLEREFYLKNDALEADKALLVQALEKYRRTLPFGVDDEFDGCPADEALEKVSISKIKGDPK